MPGVLAPAACARQGGTASGQDLSAGLEGKTGDTGDAGWRLRVSGPIGRRVKVFLEILVALATGMLFTGGTIGLALLALLGLAAAAGYGLWRLVRRGRSGRR